MLCSADAEMSQLGCAPVECLKCAVMLCSADAGVSHLGCAPVIVRPRNYKCQVMPQHAACHATGLGFACWGHKYLNVTLPRALAASSKPTVAAASGWTPAAISGLLDLWDQQSGCGCRNFRVEERKLRLGQFRPKYY